MQVVSDDFETWLIEALSQKVDQSIKEIEEKQAIQSEFLTLKKACVYTSTSYPTLKGWIKQGLPVTVLQGTQRIKRSDIDDFMAKHRIGGD